jgi:hypothetical protein
MESDHEQLADELEREHDDMAHESDALEHEIEETRDEWHARQKDAGVPGAEPPHDDDS